MKEIIFENWLKVNKYNKCEGGYKWRNVHYSKTELKQIYTSELNSL